MKPRHRLSDPVEVRMYRARCNLEASGVALVDERPLAALFYVYCAMLDLKKAEAKLDGAEPVL
jgi:hypothetical protein